MSGALDKRAPFAYGCQHQRRTETTLTEATYLDELKRYSVELDTVYGEARDEETIEDACSKLASGVAGIRWKVVNPHGPGGGWPIVEWNGTRGQLFHLLIDHYAFSVEEATDWLKD